MLVTHWTMGKVKQVWRVLVVEDDSQMREFFAASVSRCAELALAASCGTVAEAKAWLDDDRNTLDVLLTDLGLPDGSGLEVIRHAKRLHPHCEPLVISMFGDEDNVLASIEAGALGYIHKDSTPDDIAQTILDMRAGASPISPMIARRVLSKYLVYKENGALARVPTERYAMKNESLGATEGAASRGLLSPREQEVLGLIARGFSYAEIARLQALSVHTVQTHIKNLYGKLSVHSKNEAVFEATRMGLLSSLG
ncbi:MAG: response regulator transcription factor [Gammaproteobacteria bacterium]|nr:response regulator transcription factor [Rhodoferax sp.]MBU3897994.1 response regulator transcription factor [Gammaproteobacteria bacterium]MBU3995943.1 response regulator transcription factor [Gammaproteobacteria bacterium]MBU4078997.1 response regulator transcription factor [Gammaproteobacteria bacterium]MBU4112485.1 response regulator transcription factor [Gammaproteobacteria bacterium]